MPNRILKESICSSEKINKLSPEAENLFYRIIVNCDDYGRFDARTQILLCRCFPLKADEIKKTDIEKWIKELCLANLCTIYSNKGLFLQLNGWERHQSIRAKRSKYPGIDDEGTEIQHDSICKHLQANVPVFGIQSNPIQSNYMSSEMTAYVDVWNRCADEYSLRKVKIDFIKGKRKKNLDEMIECINIDQFKKCLTQLVRNNFNIGLNDRGWKASLDYVMQQKKETGVKNYIRLLEEYESENQNETMEELQ